MTTDFRPLWKHIATNRSARSYHFVQYITLQALYQTGWNPERAADRALKKLNKAFTPVTNKNKLDNGVKELDALHTAIHAAKFNSINHDILDAPVKILSETQRQQLHDTLDLLSSYEKLKEFFGRHYVYVFVRQDIFPEYQLVQAAHATLKLGTRLTGEHDPSQLYFTVVGVKDGHALNLAMHDLIKRGIKHVEFEEPDIGNQLTSIACWPIPVNQRGNLLNYKLLKFEKRT